jgi:serine/threonine protein kinase
VPSPALPAETVSPDATGARMRCTRCSRSFVAGRTDKDGRCPDDGTVLVLAPPSSAPAVDPFVGKVVDGRYRIEGMLGSGSMGTVYRARQLNIGREVAIKILRQDRNADETTHARFKREAELVAKLSSPHTVTAFDSGRTAEGEPYIVMELLRGESLGQRIAKVRRIEVAEAIDIAIQVLRSLSEAHAKGIVHRDLKPDNVYFAGVESASGSREIVKVLDFGIAKLVGRVDASLDVVETQAGAVFGTPRYMSPEQAQGLPLDARSDLYTLGAILYQMVSGRPVFDDREAVVVMARHIKTAPTLLRDLGLPVPIPEDLDNLLSDVLAKDPSLRPPTADVFAERLLRIYEATLADSSGMRVMRRSSPNPMSSASFAALGAASPPDEPTVMTDSVKESAPPPPRSRSLAIVVGSAAAVVLLGAVTWFAMMRRAPAAVPPAAVAPDAPAATPAPTPVPPAQAPPAAVAAPESHVTAAPPKNNAKAAPKGSRPTPSPATAPTPAADSPATKPSSNYGIFE